MRKGSVDIVKVYFGSAVPIVAAAAFYFVPSELLLSYIIACAVHELGHLATLKIFEVGVYSFSVELRGLVIEHGEIENPFIRLICLLAGPVAGLLFAFFCSALSGKTNMQWLDICAALSLILSIFNLMPCVPLDGGKALRCLADIYFPLKTAEIITFAASLAVSFAMILAGVYFMKRGYGYGAAATGICLLFTILCDEGIVKMPGMR